MPVTPNSECIRSRSMPWFTMLNAADKSRPIRTVTCLSWLPCRLLPVQNLEQRSLSGMSLRVLYADWNWLTLAVEWVEGTLKARKVFFFIWLRRLRPRYKIPEFFTIAPVLTSTLADANFDSKNVHSTTLSKFSKLKIADGRHIENRLWLYLNDLLSN